MQNLILSLIFFLILGCSSYTFIPLYKGNCVDRAIKVKQYLEEKGYKVDLIVGIIKNSNGTIKDAHMWLKYKKNDKWIIIKNY